MTLYNHNCIVIDNPACRVELCALYKGRNQSQIIIDQQFVPVHFLLAMTVKKLLIGVSYCQQYVDLFV